MSQLRITTWPGLLIAVPPVMAHEATVEDRPGEQGGPFLRFRPLVGPDNRLQETSIPEELYLREVFDLDATDADTMALFCSTHGRLGARRWAELHPDRPPVTFEFDNSRARFAEVIAQREGGDARMWFYWIQPLDEAAMYVRLVRDMTRVWQHYIGQLDLNDLVEQWESSHLRSKPKHTQEFLEFLVGTLGHALPAFRARAILEIQSGRQTLVDDTGAGDSSLFGTLCLQLLNHITENAQYRRCLKCGRLFVRQQGRAKFGQHRTKGENLPLYCSSSCSHAAAQKLYRDRKAQALRQQKGEQT